MSDCRTTMRASSVQETQSQNVNVLGLCDITRCTKPFTAPKKHNDLHICFGLCQRWEDCSAGVWITNANHKALLLWIHHFTACLCWISNLLLYSAVRVWLLSLDVHAELLLQTLNGDIVQPDSMRYVWNGNVERLPKEHYTSGKKSIPMNINVVFPQ